jgi:hypothetical protein
MGVPFFHRVQELYDRVRRHEVTTTRHQMAQMVAARTVILWMEAGEYEHFGAALPGDNTDPRNNAEALDYCRGYLMELADRD